MLGAQALERGAPAEDSSREILIRRHHGQAEAGDLLALEPHQTTGSASAGTEALDWVRGAR